jgi:NADH:ubiquinone oxidoreductase subunit 5 (subunit L)/multisubunit Na+/H+ antiporter MnhA subunit
LAFVSIGAGFTGLVLAYLVYVVEIFSYFKFKIPFKDEILALSANTLYLNKVGDIIFVKGMKSLTRKTAVLIDGLMIDGLVNKISTLFYNSSQKISTSQNGLIRSYVVYFGFFMLLLIGLFIATPLVVN